MLNDLDMLNKLHSNGTLDDKAYIAAVKKLGHSPKPSGLSIGDIYSGSILKPTDLSKWTSNGSGKYVATYGDGSTGEVNDVTLTGGVSMGTPLHDMACTTSVSSAELEVQPYFEDRSHLPEHAQAVLKWIDEAWDKTFKEYNDTKKDWERIEEIDEEGNHSITWTKRSAPVAYDFDGASEHEKKVSKKVEYEIKDLMTMFNLEIDHNNQP